MSQPALLMITVSTTAEAEEVVGLVLEKVLAQPASVYANERTKISKVSVYCAKLSDWSPARRHALLAELRGIKAAGLRLGSGKITAKLLPRENWAESWKKHFKPIEVGAALLVKPGWIKQRPRKGQAEVILDPGLSFGTGHHATTGFCLAQLVRSRTTGRRQSFLDIGTGSGILAIAAAKLGYAPVEAFDFDPESVRVAKENAQANGVGKSVRLRQQDLTKLPRRSAKQFDFVCANLISNLLVAERERIINRLRPGGILVLAGILKREFGEVQRAFEQYGLRLIAARSEKEWRSGAFTGTGHLHS